MVLFITLGAEQRKVKCFTVHPSVRGGGAQWSTWALHIRLRVLSRGQTILLLSLSADSTLGAGCSLR